MNLDTIIWAAALIIWLIIVIFIIPKTGFYSA